MEKMVEVERATQDELRQEKSLFQGAIRLTLEMVLEEELKAMVGARRFERVGSRKGHRNGTYLRRLLTSSDRRDQPGRRLARRRDGSLGRSMMVEAYVSGPARWGRGGTWVRRSTVSRVAKRLDEGVQTLRSAPIEGAHPYLYLDATFLDARWARKVENVSALVAYAVGPDGHRRLLGITLGPEESENSWSELLEQLLERGLSGVQLVIADEHAGLAAAVRRFLPEVRRQRCTVHLQRNVLAKVPHRLRKRVAREVAAVFRAPGLAESKSASHGALAKELPEAVNVLERSPVQAHAGTRPSCRSGVPDRATPPQLRCSTTAASNVATWISRFSNRRRSPRQPNRSMTRDLTPSYTEPFKPRRPAELSKYSASTPPV